MTKHFARNQKGLAALLLAGSIAAASAVSAQDQELTIVSYGGNYQEAQDIAYFQPYLASNPELKIRQDSPTSPAKLMAMVEAGNVTWDLVLVDDSFGTEAHGK